MSRRVRIAMTETRNAYGPMPETTDGLDALSGALESIRAKNVAHHVALIEAAAADGAQCVGLGELFTAPYFALERREFWRAMAEDAVEGPTVTTLCEVARRLGVVLVAPIYELDPNTGKRFNTAVVIDSDGRWCGRYRKTHIPSGTNERATFHETFYYGPSDGAAQPAGAQTLGDNAYFPVFPTAVGNIGVAICFDRHFEGVMSTLKAAGAELVLCPAITFGDTSMRLWRHEFPTDAMRHRMVICGSNRRGAEAPWNVSFPGGTYGVGPNGALPNVSDHEGLVIVDADLAELSGIDPAGWNLAANARPGIYGESD
jgi:beta-ureidopropionase